VERFIQEEFQDTRGTNLRAHHVYNTPAVFLHKLRIHLQELLDTMAGTQEGRPIWDIVEDGSPFRGLDVFDYKHTSIFFGREDETIEVRHTLNEQARKGCAFVLISGASGCWNHGQRRAITSAISNA
jgi:hypothetical protein